MSDERGYTLIELSVAMAVFITFMAFAMPFLFGNLQHAIRTENRIDLQQNGRAALRTMVRELRQARSLVSSDDRPSGNNAISFTAHLDGNPDGTANQITYYVQGGQLRRGRDDKSGQPIATDVASLELRFWGSNPAYDTNGNGVVEQNELDQDGNQNNWTATELAQVTRVGVTLVLRASGDEQSYTETVWLRNRVAG